MYILTSNHVHVQGRFCILRRMRESIRIQAFDKPYLITFSGQVPRTHKSQLYIHIYYVLVPLHVLFR